MSEISFKNFITKGLVTKEEEDGRRTFSGHITAEIIDKQDEFIAVEEILKTIGTWIECGAPMTEMHSNRVVAKGTSFITSEFDGHPTVKIEGEVFKKYKLHDKVWEKLQKGEYAGLSIGGSANEREPMLKADGGMAFSLKDLEIYEVAICKNPANPLAIIDNVNSIAKSNDLKITSTGDRNIIQCDSISCVVDKSSTLKEELSNIVDKHLGLGARTNVSNENLSSQDPPDTGKTTHTDPKTGKEARNYISKENVNKDMDKPEGKKEEIKDEKKDEKMPPFSKQDEILELLTKNLVKHDEVIDKQSEQLDTIQNTLNELTKKNPVTEGKVDETAPKSATGETGAKVKLSNEYQGKSEQSGINHTPEHPAIGTKVNMTKDDSAETDTKDVPKQEEMKKVSDEEPENKANPNEIVKSTDGYEYVKTETPRPSNAYLNKGSAEVPTGWDVVKALESGWNGAATTAEQSLQIMNSEFAKGNFGSGRPTGGVA